MRRILFNKVKYFHMIISVILFFLGLFILIKGSNLVVTGASKLASFFNVSAWVIGTLIVGIGTSIPELSINIASIFRGTEVGIGSIIGSNIFNILFILGLTAIFIPLALKKEWVFGDVLFNIVAVAISGIFAFFPVFGGDYFGITRSEGFVLFILFLIWLWRALSKNNENDIEKEDTSEKVTGIVACFMLLVGLAGVFVGGQWVVDGAQVFSEYIGIHESVIGIIIIGIGTSFPELAISITAIRRKMGGLAIGNIVGSSIFDFIGILGISSFFGAQKVSINLSFDFFMAFLVSIILFISMFLGTKYKLERKEGLLFVFIYMIYIIFLLSKTFSI
jgi:cation:H+ antiporter